jgi:hypothetical protein
MGTLMTESDADQPGVSEAPAAQPLVCDFCGLEAATVRRVALDRDYDRLQKPHAVQYACESCSEAKERSRLDNAPG